MINGKMNLFDTARKTIEEHQMIAAGMHVVIGVSGGADSLCLLEVLREYRKLVEFQITVVHVEHGIRGEESLADAEYVKELCDHRQIPCRIVSVDAEAYAAERGMSLEEGARELRYQAFEEIRKELGADRIAVAHNRNDQAETVLWNLVRGTGLRGLGGILPVRGRIIRPLLDVSREEIEGWMKDRSISWRMDRTNREVEYSRNRIRLELLPVMEQSLNTRAAEHIAGTARQLQEVETYLQRQTEAAFMKCIIKTDVQDDILRLSVPVLLQEEQLIRNYVLRYCIAQLLQERGLKDYSQVHIRVLEELLHKPSGKQLDLPGWVLARRRGKVLELMQKPAEQRVTRREKKN